MSVDVTELLINFLFLTRVLGLCLDYYFFGSVFEGTFSLYFILNFHLVRYIVELNNPATWK
jgi:hypothetical protein